MQMEVFISCCLYVFMLSAFHRLSTVFRAISRVTAIFCVTESARLRLNFARLRWSDPPRACDGTALQTLSIMYPNLHRFRMLRAPAMELPFRP